MCNIIPVRDYTYTNKLKKIKPCLVLHPFTSLFLFILLTTLYRRMQYETWLKKIITAISEEYELPKEEAENIFRKILNRILQIKKEEE